MKLQRITIIIHKLFMIIQWTEWMKKIIILVKSMSKIIIGRINIFYNSNNIISINKRCKYAIHLVIKKHWILMLRRVNNNQNSKFRMDILIIIMDKA